MKLSFEVLKLAVESYNSVVSFVEKRGLTEMLDTIGNVHFEAATNALEKRSMAVDKFAPVRSAITHLEAAHVAFKRIHQSHRYFRVVTWKLAGFKDVWTLALMATCYLYLKEITLAKQKAEEAKTVLYHVQNPPRNAAMSGGGGHPYAERAPEDLAGPLTLFNPVEWFKVPALISFWIGDEQANEFDGFYATIQKH